MKIYILYKCKCIDFNASAIITKKNKVLSLDLIFTFRFFIRSPL